MTGICTSGALQPNNARPALLPKRHWHAALTTRPKPVLPCRPAASADQPPRPLRNLARTFRALSSSSQPQQQPGNGPAAGAQRGHAAAAAGAQLGRAGMLGAAPGGPGASAAGLGWGSVRRGLLLSLAGGAALLAAMFLPRPVYAERGGGMFGEGVAFAREATMEMKEAMPSPSELSPDELATVKLFQDNTPSVVNIANVALLRNYFTTDIEKIPQGQGSGFIWDNKGHIVTNFHVIRGASEVQITLIDQSKYTAKFIGGDRSKDIAVLQLEAPPSVLKELKPVSVGQSSRLFVGQRVYAIGNPFGLDHSLSSGIISGLNRELATGVGASLKNMVQTDASINPGNSGGPLLDSRGRLIGINTAIADPTGRGASSGVGFAIPIDTVKGLVDQILAYGRVIRPVLGISIAPQQAVRNLGLDGVLILGVPPGSPAAKAGLQATTRDNYGRLVLGDIIVGMNGKPVKTERDLFDILDGCKVGETVQVDVLRGGAQRKTVSVTLAERAPDLVE